MSGSEARCVVCPHGESVHVMSQRRPWRGDFCSVCNRLCREDAK